MLMKPSIAPYGQNKINYAKYAYFKYVPQGSKPTYSFPTLVIWRKFKLFVHESFIALFGQNKIVYVKKPTFSIPDDSKPAYSFSMLFL
jgi:hypothetical protein